MFLAALAAALFLTACASGIERETEQRAGDKRVTVRVQETLEAADTERAAALSGATIVRIEVGRAGNTYYGSGVIWDLDSEEDILVIATCGHLLEEEDRVKVFFADGTSVWGLGEEGLPWRRSDEADAGFISVPLSSLKETQPDIRLVRLHQRLYDTLSSGDAVFAVGSTQDGVADVVCTGSLSEKALYMEEFGSDMMLLQCGSGPGMSGSGVYDGYGNFIGLLAGGDGERTAVLPMEVLNAAYEQIMGVSRNTEDYS